MRTMKLVPSLLVILDWNIQTVIQEYVDLHFLILRPFVVFCMHTVIQCNLAFYCCATPDSNRINFHPNFATLTNVIK